MNWILLNILLGALMVAFTVGLPAWVMWRFPEQRDESVANIAALRTREHASPATRSTHQHRTSGAPFPSTSA
jgi:hypothetical protein